MSKSLEEEVGFEDSCPWMNEEEPTSIPQEENPIEEEEEFNPEEWVVVDEVVEEEIVADEVEEQVLVVESGGDRRVVVLNEANTTPEEGQPKTSKSRVRRQLCPVCGERYRHLYRHAANHLPWFWFPETCCGGCQSQHLFPDFLANHLKEQHQPDFQPNIPTSILADLIKNYLLALAEYFGQHTLEDFIWYIQHSKFELKNQEFKESDICLCRALDTVLQKAPDCFIFTNEQGELTIFTLVHWRLVLGLLSQLPADVRNSLPVSLPPAIEEDKEPGEDQVVKAKGEPEEDLLEEENSHAVLDPTDFTDAHLHLDHFLARVGDPDRQDFDLFRSSPGASVKYLVSNYCFPRSWPRQNEVRDLLAQVPGLYLTFGIHPKVVQTTNAELLEEYIYILEDLLKLDNTVAIGECGLDTSNTAVNLNLQRQIHFLERQLELAVQRGLAVVIHCRGNAALHFQLLDSLSKICPSSHPIHWHCFSGIPQIYSQLVSKFTNIVFGVTPFVFSKPSIASFIQQQQLTNLVLESDAPFIPSANHQSEPAIAAKISEILGIPLEEIATTTNENVRRIYRL